MAANEELVEAVAQAIHPANPNNGGPIFRLSPKGEPFIGACGKHYAKHDAPSEEQK